MSVRFFFLALDRNEYVAQWIDLVDYVFAPQRNRDEEIAQHEVCEDPQKSNQNLVDGNVDESFVVLIENANHQDQHLKHCKSSEEVHLTPVYFN